MKYRMLVTAVALALSLSGCVLKSEHLKSLAEIEGLQKEKAGLLEQNAAQEKKIAELKQEKTGLESERARLLQENENIKSTLESKRDKLANEVVELKNRLSENENRIAELDRQLAELKRQSEQLAQEKAQAVEEKERALAQMKNTYESLVSEMKQEIKEGEIQITQLKDKLTVNMVDKILFDSGSAVVKAKGQKVLDRVAEILKKVTDRQIRVEGHTDNVPISASLAERFPSNWELSTARATTVVRYLQSRGLDPKILSAGGYGEYQPVAPNDTDVNKAKNRRIEIVLVPMEPAQ